MSNKRYLTLNDYNKKKYGSKVCKISLNGSFTCPNIDGSKGTGGCIYCSSKGSGDFAGNPKETLEKQYNEIKTMMENKWDCSKTIAYFQANSNTYKSVDKLKELYEPVLKFDGVIGLAIATRADAISDDVIDYLSDLNKRTDLTIELGLQTIHPGTSLLINRCMNLKEFEITYNKLKNNNINVVVHVINGLPYETKEMMIDTVKYLNKIKIDGIKIHMLHIIKNTKLAKMYENESFHILSREEYVDIVCDQLEYLDESIVVHRITGDPVKEDLIEPTWLLKKFCVLNEIDKELKRRNTYQGAKKEV